MLTGSTCLDTADVSHANATAEKAYICYMTNKHYRRNGFGSMNHKVLNCQFNIQTAGRQIVGDLVFSLLESCQSMYLTDNHKQGVGFLVAIKCESSTNEALQ